MSTDLDASPIIISVGGSLIVPDAIDTDFLTHFTTLIKTEVERGKRFVLISGGGKLARRYQDAASSVTELTPEDLDWLGLHATRLNGHLLRTLFREVAYPVMMTNPDEVSDTPPDTKIIVAAGYRPGASTDLRAVQIAKNIGAQKVVNLSNIDYVYTDDPRKNPNAQKIEEINWPEFRKLLPEDWDPGLSSPFDPIAAREAETHQLEVAVINGAHLDRLEAYLEDKPFEGTVIKD